MVPVCAAKQPAKVAGDRGDVRVRLQSGRPSATRQHPMGGLAQRPLTGDRRTRWHGMSNVLIGIIGVALFIGLAIAGAVLLGDDIRIASDDSKATAVASGLNQISQALDLRSLRTGTSIAGMASQQSDLNAMLVPRFLKEPYLTAQGAAPQLQQLGAKIYVTLGGIPMTVCRALHFQGTGQSELPDADGATLPDPPGRRGCMRFGDADVGIAYIEAGSA